MKLDLNFSANSQLVKSSFSEDGGSFSSKFGDVSVIHDGQNGATFYPEVSADGIISWTNDRELPNPNPVNIKGEKGDKGDKGERGLQGVQGVQGERGAEGAKGDKGDKGDRGEQGQSGVYVGSGEMPDGYNVQIDPNGDDATDSLVAAVIAALPVYGGEVENV